MAKTADRLPATLVRRSFRSRTAPAAASLLLLLTRSCCFVPWSSSSHSNHSFAAPSLLAAAVVVETRRSVLRPWNSRTERQHQLGWTIERRESSSATPTKTPAPVDRVTVGWKDEKENEVTIDLPHIGSDSLASTIWPASLASAILVRSPTLTDFMGDRDVLELGCGLGITGLAASKSKSPKPRSCRLTDNADEVLDALRCYGKGRSGVAAAAADEVVSFEHLDWRDDHAGCERVGTVLSTDVAYYYFLLRPLMDTVSAHLEPRDSLWMNTGQANRECQWTLYRNLVDGCYNQLTDEREPPWGGQTRMLLYELDMYEWREEEEGGGSGDDATEKENVCDGTIPIAVMLHQTPGLSLAPLTDFDYVATASDESEMSISF